MLMEGILRLRCLRQRGFLSYFCSRYEYDYIFFTDFRTCTQQAAGYFTGHQPDAS